MPKKAQSTKNKPPDTVPKRALSNAAVAPRILTEPKRRWLRLSSWHSTPVTKSYKPLPKARLLFVKALKHLWMHKKLFGGITLFYGVLNLILVRGLSGSAELGNVKQILDGVSNGLGGKMISAGTTFAYLLSNSGSGSSSTSGLYQSILFIICSLAFIWALRQTVAGKTVGIRDSFYLGMYPLIPFLILFFLLMVQLLPFAIGSGLYSLVTANGITVNGLEKTVFVLIFIVLALWSLRMILATIFAFYTVTLPDMTPLRAYRSARELVVGRRLQIWRKLIFLPAILLLAASVIEIPLILFATPVAVWAFFVLSMLILPLVHSYIYNLYREMI